MSYRIIEPPFTLKFREMPTRELRAYAAWFHEIMPGRIEEMSRTVKRTPGFEGWKPDETPGSLERLGEWFESQVETRRSTAEEMDELQAGLTFAVEILEEELTNKTFSLAMDVGMYFGRVVLKNLSGSRWDQPLKNRRFVDYGQPVIIGLGAVPLNPVRIMVMTAYGVSRQKPARLRELYDTWVSFARTRPKGHQAAPR